MDSFTYKKEMQLFQVNFIGVRVCPLGSSSPAWVMPNTAVRQVNPNGPSEITQEVKVFAVKPEDLDLILRPQLNLEVDNQLHKVVF